LYHHDGGDGETGGTAGRALGLPLSYPKGGWGVCQGSRNRRGEEPTIEEKACYHQAGLDSPRASSRSDRPHDRPIKKRRAPQPGGHHTERERERRKAGERRPGWIRQSIAHTIVTREKRRRQADGHHTGRERGVERKRRGETGRGMRQEGETGRGRIGSVMTAEDVRAQRTGGGLVSLRPFSVASGSVRVSDRA
jgi:hypothetical protein